MCKRKKICILEVLCGGFHPRPPSAFHMRGALASLGNGLALGHFSLYQALYAPSWLQSFSVPRCLCVIPASFPLQLWGASFDVPL